MGKSLLADADPAEADYDDPVRRLHLDTTTGTGCTL